MPLGLEDVVAAAADQTPSVAVVVVPAPVEVDAVTQAAAGVGVPLVRLTAFVHVVVHLAAAVVAIKVQLDAAHVVDLAPVDVGQVAHVAAPTVPVSVVADFD